ncbi:MAG TPA: hypothetical protein VF101_05370 [Gaiellaceae bacterium]
MLRGRWLLVAACAAALTADAPASNPPTRQLLKLAAPIQALAADGEVAAVATTGCPDVLVAWDPVQDVSTGVSRPKCRDAHNPIEATVASREVAWVDASGGNFTSTTVLTETIGKPRSVAELASRARASDGGLGDSVGNVFGDGSLLVFSLWSWCLTEPENGDYAACPKGIPICTPTLYREQLWRIAGGRKRLLMETPNQLEVLGVAAGRILVRRADGSLELRSEGGALLRSFRFEPGEVRSAVVDDSELVVLDRNRTWRVYDVRSGRLERVLPIVAGTLSAIRPVRADQIPLARVLDAERGLVAYAIGRVVHVLRLSDGREATFRVRAVVTPYRPPVLVQLEPSGLFYAYNVSLRPYGRVRFVPLAAFRFE